ncbi:MAG: alanyl-tRNA synthetase, partial [Planctomycetota bacterium]
KPMKEFDFNAGKIIREIAKAIQGGGGGQAFYASAGGKKVEGLDEALDLARKMLAK